MFSLNGIKELVEVFLDLLPSRRKEAVRKRKLENLLLQAQIQKTVAGTRQIDSMILHKRLDIFNEFYDALDIQLANLSTDSREELAIKIWEALNGR